MPPAVPEEIRRDEFGEVDGRVGQPQHGLPQLCPPVAFAGNVGQFEMFGRVFGQQHPRLGQATWVGCP